METKATQQRETLPIGMALDSQENENYPYKKAVTVKGGYLGMASNRPDTKVAKKGPAQTKETATLPSRLSCLDQASDEYLGQTRKSASQINLLCTSGQGKPHASKYTCW